MTPARAVRALLVEGAQAKLGVDGLLDGHPMLIDVVQADDLAAALDHLALGTFDVVLFALSLTGDQGRKALRRVLTSVQNVPVIVLAVAGDAQLAHQSITRGAQDFWLSPDETGDRLVRTIASSSARSSGPTTGSFHCRANSSPERGQAPLREPTSIQLNPEPAQSEQSGKTSQ